MLEPNDAPTPEAVHRLQRIDGELRRLYPAVCVPDSTERAEFLDLLGGEDFANNPEHSLLVAFIVLEPEHPGLPDPWSPVLHPRTILEQLCFVRFWNMEFHAATAEDAFAYLEQTAKTLGDEMRRWSDEAGTEELAIRFLMPPGPATQSRFTLSLHGVTLAEALRAVAEAVGLAVRLVNGQLLVCSEEVGAALDQNHRHGFQAPLWEIRHLLGPQQRVLRPEDRRNLRQEHPKLAVPLNPEAICFNAHFLLAGTSETAWDLASQLFKEPPSGSTDQPTDEVEPLEKVDQEEPGQPPPKIPGVDEPGAASGAE